MTVNSTLREEIATKSDCCFANVTTDGANRICTNCSFPCYFITEEAQEAIEALIQRKQVEARIEELERLSIGSTTEVRRFYVDERTKQINKGLKGQA